MEPGNGAQILGTCDSRRSGSPEAEGALRGWRHWMPAVAGATRLRRPLAHRVDDDGPSGGARFAGEICGEVLLDPGEREAVRLLRFLDLVEDADRRHRVVRGVDHVIADEAGDGADDRNEFLDFLGETVGLTRLRLVLAQCGVHG